MVKSNIFKLHEYFKIIVRHLTPQNTFCLDSFELFFYRAHLFNLVVILLQRKESSFVSIQIWR